MEELRIKVHDIEQSMQNILESMSWQGQTSQSASHQQAGMPSNLGSSSSPDEVMPEQQFNSHANHSVPVVNNIFTSNIYQKLPHPFSQTLSELPIIDGSDVNALWEFLLRVIHMNQVGQLTMPGNYEILYPYCRGEVLHLLLQAMSVGVSFYVFHERLTQFIPARTI
jgi:hypothetical protein